VWAPARAALTAATGRSVRPKTVSWRVLWAVSLHWRLAALMSWPREASCGQSAALVA
jgi:hypothetical protein